MKKIIICQILKVFYLKIKFYQIFYTKLTPSLVLEKSYKKQKFDKLTLREIKGTFNNFRKNLKSKKKIEISKLNSNLFLIYKK